MKQYTIEELNSLQKEEVVALMVQLQKQNDILTEQLAVMCIRRRPAAAGAEQNGRCAV